MTLRRLPLGLLLLFAAALFAAPAVRAAGPAARSLVTTDGTLYEVRTGTVADLALEDVDIDPATQVIQWTSQKESAPGSRESRRKPRR